MNPVYATYTATGTTTPIIVDQAVAPFALTVGCYIESGSGTYGLQFTLDDPNLGDPNDPGVRWFADTNIPAGSTTSLVTSYAYPIRAIRLDITVATTLSLELKVIQGYSIT